MSIPIVWCPGYRNGEITAHADRPASAYGALMDVFREAGLDPVVYQPDWEDPETGPDLWTEDMLDLVARVTPRAERVIVAGFSLGGLIAASTVCRIEHCSEVSVDTRLLAASPSPWHTAEIRHSWPNTMSELNGSMPEWLRSDLTNFRFRPFITSPAQLYVGTEEVQTMHYNHANLAARILGAQAMRVAGVAHDVLHPGYIAEIRDNLSSLVKRERPSAEACRQYYARWAMFVAAENDGRSFLPPHYGSSEDHLRYSAPPKVASASAAQV